MAKNSVDNLYTLIKDARKLAIYNTVRTFLTGEHSFTTTFFQAVYHEKLTTGYGTTHLSRVFYNTWEEKHKKNQDLRTLIDKDGENIATALLGHNGTQLQPPAANSVFTTQNTAYKETLPKTKIKHAWIMGTTMFVGYGGLLAAGIYSWCTFLPPINEGMVLVESMKTQLLDRLQDGTLSRLDQRLLELAIQDAQIVAGNNVLILAGITLGVIVGFCSFWALSIPIDGWRDKQNLGALEAAVQALTTTTIALQEPENTNLLLGDIATIEGKNLLNVLLALKQAENERRGVVSLQ